ncbi:MAG: response regulator [Anaerolineales bacterium]|nr:response regulator [Anaerolineales bacterium]MCW5855271.1 response regulator [Anaerolineales bacterium]
MAQRLLLAIKDMALAQQAASEIFAPLGVSVVFLGDDVSISSAFQANTRPDVLLIDAGLAGDGLSALAHLRAEHPNVPVLLAAAHPTPELLRRALQAGVSDVLSLPLQTAQVQAALQQAEQQRQQWNRWLRRETGALSRRASEMETILSQANDGLMLLDQQGRILMVNQALRHTFDLGEGDLTGHPVGQVLNLPGFAEALAAAEPLERYEVENSQGRVFHLRLADLPGVGRVLSLHDVSHFKELDKLKGDFVNTVSHDLRSPLTAILGYVELIERSGEVNPQQSDFIQRVKASVHATTGLIDDLLKLSRVEVADLDEHAAVDMNQVLANVARDTQSAAQDKGMTIEVQAAPGLPAVVGSRTQLHQLADNLLGNALKYTPAGGRVRATLREKDNQVILQVADNGPGIPLEEQGRIFDKFYRASNIQADLPGTGLGLAIVKTVVDNHGGRIWVDSQPGKGSVFTVVLPVANRQ